MSTKAFLSVLRGACALSVSFVAHLAVSAGTGDSLFIKACRLSHPSLWGSKEYRCDLNLIPAGVELVPSTDTDVPLYDISGASASAIGKLIALLARNFPGDLPSCPTAAMPFAILFCQNAAVKRKYYVDLAVHVLDRLCDSPTLCALSDWSENEDLVASRLLAFLSIDLYLADATAVIPNFSMFRRKH